MENRHAKELAHMQSMAFSHQTSLVSRSQVTAIGLALASREGT